MSAGAAPEPAGRTVAPVAPAPPSMTRCHGSRPALTAAAAVALAAAACAPPPLSAANTSPLLSVRGVLTSALEPRPYTARELVSPEVRPEVERCERAARPRCREREVPVDHRRGFILGVAPEVIAVFQLEGLPPGAAREVGCRFVDPAGRTAAATTLSYAPPPGTPTGAAPAFACSLDLAPSASLGGWAVELAVDGESAAVLRFRVLEGPGGLSV
jgi:hypothetical protein